MLRRNTVGRGVVEEAERRMGTWSEVAQSYERRSESGRTKFHWVLTSARSILARIGTGWLLVQVKRRSRSGISTRPTSSIQELNIFASLASRFPFDCSEEERSRLKTPTTTQGPEILAATEVSSARKNRFVEALTGAVIISNMKERSDVVEEKIVVRRKMRERERDWLQTKR